MTKSEHLFDTPPMTLAVSEPDYATEPEESTASLSCLAAPVSGDFATVVGAVTVCIPRATLPDSKFPELRRVVLQAARCISTHPALHT